MKYYLDNAIREDSSTKLPEGAILLTNEQYQGLLNESLIVVNGEVVEA